MTRSIGRSTFRVVIGFLISFVLLQWLGICILYLIYTGVGVWGNRSPIFWGWPIVNFVFWVGIGHAGTLISAILFLFRQEWRTSINRAAEAMTIFAVICAGLFPGIHIGRVWAFYWLFPVPTEHLAMWPNFRSPLLWDVISIGLYFTACTVYLYVPLLPDLALIRDSGIKAPRLYRFLAAGYRDTPPQRARLERAIGILSIIVIPIAVSVHTVIGWIFAMTLRRLNRQANTSVRFC